MKQLNQGAQNLVQPNFEILHEWSAHRGVSMVGAPMDLPRHDVPHPSEAGDGDSDRTCCHSRTSEKNSKDHRGSDRPLQPGHSFHHFHWVNFRTRWDLPRLWAMLHHSTSRILLLHFVQCNLMALSTSSVIYILWSVQLLHVITTVNLPSLKPF